MEQDKTFNHRMPMSAREARIASASAEAALAGIGLRMHRIQPGEPLGDVPRLRARSTSTSRASSATAASASPTAWTIAAPRWRWRRGQQAIATLRLHDFSPLAVQVEYGSLFRIDEFART